MKDIVFDDLGRKFIFALLVVIAGFVLVLTGKASVEQWFNFAELIGGIYVAGNVGEKVANVLKGQGGDNSGQK